MPMYNNVMYNYVQHYAIKNDKIMIFVMFMCMNDILNVLNDIDDIPNYNYCIFLHFRGACIHL